MSFVFVFRCFSLLALLSLTGCGGAPEPTVPKALIVKLQRLATSPLPTVDQVRPYEEGLVFYSYAVREVVHGELDAKQIQLAHWAVVDSEPQPVDADLGEVIEAEILPMNRVPGAEDLYQSNDLPDFESPQYVEVPPATQAVAAGFREHYGGAISKQMSLYWKLRPQLELVALGNSRTGVGVLTGEFFPERNAGTPVALNLAPPGSNMELQSLLAEEYLAPLPKLRWVVWGICPRYFNTKRRDSDRLDTFTESHGRKYDLDNHDELWPVREFPPLLTVEELLKEVPKGTDPWGATPRPDGHSPVLPDEAARERFAYDYFSIVRFRWDQPQWDLFEKATKELDKRNIRVLLFTPPTHPLAREGKACDPDGSGREDDALVIGKLRELDRELPNVWFEDIHRAGHHDFTPDDFSDAGHLDRSGAERLTAKLVGLVNNIEKSSATAPVPPAP